MRKLILNLVFIGSLLLVGCSTHDNNLLTDTEKENIKSEIFAVFEQLSDHAKTLNHDQVISFYYDHPDFIFISTGMKTNYAGFFSGSKEYYNMTEEQIFNDEEKHIEIINRETVLFTHASNARANLKNGSIIKVEPAVMTLLFKKIDNSWKITYVHESGNHVYLNKDSIDIK